MFNEIIEKSNVLLYKLEYGKKSPISNELCRTMGTMAITHILPNMVSSEALYIRLLTMFYRLQRSCGKVMFSQAPVILFTREMCTFPGQITPSGPTPPKQTPPWADTTWAHTPSRHTPLLDNPYPRDGYCSLQYIFLLSIVQIYFLVKTCQPLPHTKYGLVGSF